MNKFRFNISKNKNVKKLWKWNLNKVKNTANIDTTGFKFKCDMCDGILKWYFCVIR